MALKGTPPADIYNRWVAFGLFSTHSRLHGSGSYRIPWADYGEVAANTLAKFVETKHRLMPYIYKFVSIILKYLETAIEENRLGY